MLLFLSLLMFLAGCSSSPQQVGEDESYGSGELGRIEPHSAGESVLAGNNRVETAGAALYLPENWRARRAPEEEVIIHFSSPDDTYSGSLAVFSYPFEVDPQGYAYMYAEKRRRSDGKEGLLVLPPDAEEKREWYLFRSYEEGVHTETAMWAGTDLHRVYLLSLDIVHQGPVESTEGRVPELSSGSRLVRDAIFSHLLKTAPSLEGRYLPEHSLRFVSSGIWRWIADYRGGVQLAGYGAGGYLAVSLFPVERDVSAAELLEQEFELNAEEPASEEVSTHRGEFLVRNRPIGAQGASALLGERRSAALYLLPEAVGGGPWALRIEVMAREDDDAYDEALLREPYKLRELQALFERQIYFDWES